MRLPTRSHLPPELASQKERIQPGRKKVLIWDRAGGPVRKQEEYSGMLRQGGRTDVLHAESPSFPRVHVGFTTKAVSVEPKQLRFNRNGLGSSEHVSVQTKRLRFHRKSFGSTGMVSVEPKRFRLNRRGSG